MTTRSRIHAAGDALAGDTAEIRRYPLLGRSEEFRLARLAGVGDPAARRRLVQSNPRLAADRLALVADALDALDERPRRVIELRFGVDGRDPRTLDEVAGELGLSRQRAGTIEATALRRLSASSELEPVGSAAWTGTPS